MFLVSVHAYWKYAGSGTYLLIVCPFRYVLVVCSGIGIRMWSLKSRTLMRSFRVPVSDLNLTHNYIIKPSFGGDNFAFFAAGMHGSNQRGWGNLNCEVEPIGRL